MKLILNLEIYYKWEEENPDMSVCSGCGEQIYSTMHRLVLAHVLNDGRDELNATNTVICESCFELMDKI